MKLPQPSRRQVIAAIVLTGGIVCLALFISTTWQRTSGQLPAEAASNAPNNTSKNKPGSSPAAQTPEIESPSPACRQFTLITAKTILGSGSTVSTQDSAVISDTADMLISACTYVGNNSSSIKLTAYIAKTSVGESTNSLMFGSGKPGGVQDVPGYGQAAYWDQTTNTLLILKDNNRYDLARTIGSSPATLDDVLHAADSIIPKL